MHADQLPVGASDLVNVAPASQQDSFSPLSLTSQSRGTRIEGRRRGGAGGERMTELRENEGGIFIETWKRTSEKPQADSFELSPSCDVHQGDVTGGGRRPDTVFQLHRGWQHPNAPCLWQPGEIINTASSSLSARQDGTP
ncbi:unnamed protein product [Pleuronectes platessa]|uniref:Uncharacterized protein n=1 Tax=Pleuronectes platessa TaxID=8262 RepID=A0A9N7VPL0_PLEPL|nr:unnamed protein product [Pleuronectes platessa]